MLIPVWFLVFALVVPRISLFILWIHGFAFAVPQPGAGLAWFFLPRILVLVTIYTLMGFCPWFWVHLGAATIAWLLGARRAEKAQKKEAQ